MCVFSITLANPVLLSMMYVQSLPVKLCASLYFRTNALFSALVLPSRPRAPCVMMPRTILGTPRSTCNANKPHYNCYLTFCSTEVRHCSGCFLIVSLSIVNNQPFFLYSNFKTLWSFLQDNRSLVWLTCTLISTHTCCSSIHYIGQCDSCCVCWSMCERFFDDFS